MPELLHSKSKLVRFEVPTAGNTLIECDAL
jgi:hypothetical protein